MMSVGVAVSRLARRSIVLLPAAIALAAAISCSPGHVTPTPRHASSGDARNDAASPIRDQDHASSTPIGDASLMPPAEGEAASKPSVKPGSATPPTEPQSTPNSNPGPPLGPGNPSAQPTNSGGWMLTVYYTAVQAYHSGPPQQVRGCLQINCAHGQDNLGTYPRDFVQAVKDEGTGRITSGPNASKYLNWSIDVGYWLDSAPRDARGGALLPWISAAADPAIPFGSRFSVLDCGVDDSTKQASDVPASTCGRIQRASWRVVDRFTSPNVGKHVDLYIGEENEPNFVANSPLVISTQGAITSLP